MIKQSLVPAEFPNLACPSFEGIFNLETEKSKTDAYYVLMAESLT